VHKLKLPTYVHKDHETHRTFQQDLSGAWIEFEYSMGRAHLEVQNK
jgi:hypothetical protein